MSHGLTAWQLMDCQDSEPRNTKHLRCQIHDAGWLGMPDWPGKHNYTLYDRLLCLFSQDPGIAILGSHLAGLAQLSLILITVVLFCCA